MTYSYLLIPYVLVLAGLALVSLITLVCNTSWHKTIDRVAMGAMFGGVIGSVLGIIAAILMSCVGAWLAVKLKKDLRLF